MPLVDQTFSDRDIIRIWRRHLTRAEKKRVLEFFCRLCDAKRDPEDQPTLVELLKATIPFFRKTFPLTSVIFQTIQIVDDLLHDIEGFELPPPPKCPKPVEPPLIEHKHVLEHKHISELRHVHVQQHKHVFQHVHQLPEPEPPPRLPPPKPKGSQPARFVLLPGQTIHQRAQLLGITVIELLKLVSDGVYFSLGGTGSATSGFGGATGSGAGVGAAASVAF